MLPLKKCFIYKLINQSDILSIFCDFYILSKNLNSILIAYIFFISFHFVLIVKIIFIKIKKEILKHLFIILKKKKSLVYLYLQRFYFVTYILSLLFCYPILFTLCFYFVNQKIFLQSNMWYITSESEHIYFFTCIACI